MTWVAVAIGGGGLLGAGATLYGANQASQNVNSNDIRRSSGDTLADPTLGALSLESLQGLGSTFGVEGITNQSSPMEQFIEGIMRSDQLSDKQKRRAESVFRYMADNGLSMDKIISQDFTPEEWNAIPAGVRKVMGETQRAIAAVGYQGFGDWNGLMAAQDAFTQKEAAFQAYMAPLADTIRRNRVQGAANLADIAGNAGMRTDELAALYEPQIAQQFQDQRNNVLQAANAGRFNPGAALGRLGETQALTQKTSAIERALQILGGQVDVTQRALAPAQELALATSGQRQNATLNAANIGAAQLGAQQQLSQQNNQAQGTGIASAGGQLGNLGVLMAILGQGQTAGPAGATSQAELNRRAQQDAYLTSLGVNP